jgi:hypothetical protein
MKIHIYLLSLIVAMVAAVAPIAPAQANTSSLPEVRVPSWLEPYTKQLWNPGGLATLAFLGVTGGIRLVG